jgi:hypothetical protein
MRTVVAHAEDDLVVADDPAHANGVHLPRGVEAEQVGDPLARCGLRRSSNNLR